MKFEIITENNEDSREQPVKIYLCESGEHVDVVVSHPNYGSDLHVLRFQSDGTLGINNKIEDRLQKIGFKTKKGGLQISSIFPETF